MVKFNTDKETIDASKKNVVINNGGVVNGKPTITLQVNDAASKKIVKFDKVVSITTDKGTTKLDHTKPISQVIDTVRTVCEKQFEEDKTGPSSKIKIYILNNGTNVYEEDDGHSLNYTVAEILEVEAGTGLSEIFDKIDLSLCSDSVKNIISNWLSDENHREYYYLTGIGIFGNTVVEASGSNGTYNLRFNVNASLTGLKVGDIVNSKDYPNDCYSGGWGYQVNLNDYQSIASISAVSPDDPYKSNKYLSSDSDGEIPLCDGMAIIVG